MKAKKPQNLEVNMEDVKEINSITDAQALLLDRLIKGSRDTGKSVIVSCVATNFNKTGKNRIVIAEPRENGYHLFYSDGTNTYGDVDGILLGCETRDDAYKCMSILRGVKTEAGFEERLQKARKITTQK